MAASSGTCPLTEQQVVDRYFLEQRAHVLDIAAFLDRLERSAQRNTDADFRLLALRQALQTLASDAPARTERILMILSDPTVEPRAELDQKSAAGAFDPDGKGKVL